MPARGGGNMYVDDHTGWTYGNVRPLYGVREARCLSCPSGGRFVPADPKIAFICLIAFQVDYGKYEMAVKAAILDDWPSSSVEPRAYRK